MGRPASVSSFADKAMQFFHFFMAGMAHVDAENISAGMKKALDHLWCVGTGAEGC